MHSGLGEREKETKPTSVANSTPECELGASCVLTGLRTTGLSQEEHSRAVRVVQRLNIRVVFMQRWSTNTAQLAHPELYQKSRALRDGRMSFQSGSFKKFSRIIWTVLKCGLTQTFKPYPCI